MVCKCNLAPPAGLRLCLLHVLVLPGHNNRLCKKPRQSFPYARTHTQDTIWHTDGHEHQSPTGAQPRTRPAGRKIFPSSAPGASMLGQGSDRSVGNCMTLFPSALLLDMDGTLFDSEPLHKRIWQEAARACSLPLSDEVYHRSFVGATLSGCLEVIQRLGGPGFSLKEFAAQLAASQEAHATPPFKPGARALLDWAGRQEIPLALVTSGTRDSVQANFAREGGTEAFVVQVTLEDVLYPKPAPDPYLLACRKLDVSPQETLAVEDSETGATAALTAGCQTVIIPDLLPPAPGIRQRASAVLSSLEDLPDWIGRQRKQPATHQKEV